MHSSTGVTPFVAYHGAGPRGTEWRREADSSEAPAAMSVARRVTQLQTDLKQKLIAVTQYQKKYADRKRMHKEFDIGDQVLVSSRNMKSSRPKGKLDYKFVGPGTVVSQIGPVAYKVNLPGQPHIHPVFHVSLLEPWKPSGAHKHPDVPIKDALQEYGEDVYDVERIVERRRNAVSLWEYFVKWKGYPSSQNTWEPSANLSKATLKVFAQRSKGHPKRKRSLSD